jgi:hypothetical protein
VSLPAFRSSAQLTPRTRTPRSPATLAQRNSRPRFEPQAGIPMTSVTPVPRRPGPHHRRSNGTNGSSHGMAVASPSAHECSGVLRPDRGDELDRRRTGPDRRRTSYSSIRKQRQRSGGAVSMVTNPMVWSADVRRGTRALHRDPPQWSPCARATAPKREDSLRPGLG